VNEPPAKRRRWPIIAGAVIVGLILLLALLRHFMQPERLSAALIAQAEAATGLDIELAAPADISLWPDLNIVLRGLQARPEPGARPLLSAERAELALPWGALLGNGIEITALRLVRPRLDRDVLQAWLGPRPTMVGPPAPPRLPRLTAELRIIDGQLIGRAREAWQLRDIQLSLSRLLPGEEFRLSVAASYVENELAQPLELEASGRLHAAGMPVELAPLALRWLDAEGEDRLRLNGQLELAWPHRLQLMLDGRLRHWPQDWPGLPAAQGFDEGELALALNYRGTPAGAGPLQLALARGDLEARYATEASALLNWLLQPGQRLLPPGRGEVSAPRLQQGGLLIEGLRVELGEPLSEPDKGGDAEPIDGG
jgi:hypothetical protein